MLMRCRLSESITWALDILVDCPWCASFYLCLHVYDYALDTISTPSDSPTKIGKWRGGSGGYGRETLDSAIGNSSKIPSQDISSPPKPVTVSRAPNSRKGIL